MKAWMLSGALLAAPAMATAASTCHGLVHLGRIDGAVRLPQDGPNFSAYSSVAAMAGRTYVHSEVAAILLGAYGALHQALPGTVFVYGETGGARGGRFRPHRTHQNGLSVDFFVPVRDAAGKSVPLPTPATTRFGYDIEFDAQGRYGAYRIDFPALAEHLFQLDTAARARGLGLAKVIVDPRYDQFLFSTPRGAYLKARLPFMKGKPWVRHDEHYHVDFAVPCTPEKKT
jgi:penicillin-insensitive murein DD-endopeptidase